MTGYLYFNKSPRNKIIKTLTNQNQITIRYKEDTSIFKPDLMISNSIVISNYNYIHVGGNIDRFYYIESYEMSQQYYILHCKEDVLMSFKPDIFNTECIIAKNENNFNLFLDDNKMKLYNKERILTKPFLDNGGNPSGFYVDGEKVFTMLLTVNGSGSSSNNS